MINRMYVIILLSVLPLTACGSAQGGEKTEAIGLGSQQYRLVELK